MKTKIRLALIGVVVLFTFFLSGCLSLMGIKFTELNGVKVVQVNDKFEGKPVIFDVFYFDTFQGFSGGRVQIVLHIVDRKPLPKYRLVYMGEDSLIPGDIRIKTEEREFVVPLSTWDVQRQAYSEWRGGQYYTATKQDEAASYVITDELRSSLLGAQKIIFEVNHKMRELNHKDVVNFKTLLADDVVPPANP